MSTRKIALLPVVVALAASGCQVWTGASGTARPDEDGDARTGRTSAIYATVIRQLVTKDFTFGKRVFVVDGVVQAAGDPHVGGKTPGRPFSSAVKREILGALRDLPPVRFVADPDTIVVKSCGCVRGGGVLISLGPIARMRGDAVTVANGLFFAGKGGQWLTYVLEPEDASWRVVGTKVPTTIS